MKKSSLLLIVVFMATVIYAQDAVVAPVRMNILYLGVANPVEIAVPGVSSDKISVTVDNGNISRSATGWEIKPGVLDKCVVSVFANKKKVADKIFRVKPIPKPVAIFAGTYTGSVSLNKATENGTLEAKLPEFDWDLQFRITSFTMLYQKDGYDYELYSKGNVLTDEMKVHIRELSRDRYIIFKDIKAVGPDGKTTDLEPVAIKLNQG